MSFRKELSHDPVTGVTEYFHYDPITDTTAVETVQNVDPVLEANKERANSEQYTKDGIKDSMWHYASIPIVVQMRWLAEYGRENWPLRPGNEKLLFRLLNSPEWSYLKTTNKIHA